MGLVGKKYLLQIEMKDIVSRGELFYIWTDRKACQIFISQQNFYLDCKILAYPCVTVSQVPQLDILGDCSLF